MTHQPLVLDVPDGGRLLSRAFQDSGFCVVGGPELIFGQDMKGWRPPAGKFDGVIGGPPCQAHSMAGKLSQNVEREDLIPEWCAIVAAAKPVWFLMENVRHAPIPRIDDYLSESYLLNRLSLGVPKRRIRRFTFGIRALQGPIYGNLVRWSQAMADVLPQSQWPKRWFPVHPLDPPGCDSQVDPQRALCAHDSRGVPREQRKEGGHSEGLPGWLVYDLQPALLASDGRSHLKGSDSNYKYPSGLTGWLGRTISLEMAWAHMGLPGEPPPTFSVKSKKYFTKEGAIRLLGNGVPYDMGRHVARAVCLALSMPDPGSVVRQPDQALFKEQK